MPLYLGIDGGQSSTTAAVGDENGRELGRGKGGPCNHITGPEAATRFRIAMADAIAAALRQAAIQEDAVVFQGACLGLSGGADDKLALAKEVIPTQRLKVTHDAEIAWAGATGCTPGLIVIAGTGSIAWGRNKAGVSARAGGWGYRFGDEGGAFFLARQALRAALQFEEGWGPPTQLHAALLQASPARSAGELLHRWYALERSEIARFASVVDKTALAGDTAALAIFQDAGQQLARYAVGVHKQLFRPEDAYVVSYVGGTFESQHLLHSFSAAVQEKLGARVSTPVMDAAAGALAEARTLR